MNSKIVLSLNASTRTETGKKNAALRKSGFVPAVLYGHKIEPRLLKISQIVLEKSLEAAGESTLIDLTIENEQPVKVLIQDYQLDPVNNRLIHMDLHQVRMDEKLHTEIELKFINEAPAVKELSGILVTNMDRLEVQCLPNDLVHEIEVDLSSLKTFDDVIHVKDVIVPSGLQVLNVPDDLVALIQEPRSEKEMEQLESKPEEKLPEAEAAAPEEAPKE